MLAVRALQYKDEEDSHCEGEGQDDLRPVVGESVCPLLTVLLHTGPFPPRLHVVRL